MGTFSTAGQTQSRLPRVLCLLHAHTHRGDSPSSRRVQAVLAELVATAIFVAVGSASVVFSHDVRTLGGTFYPNGDSVTAAGTLPPGSPTTVATYGGVPVGYNVASSFPIPRIVNISFVFGLMISVLVFATGSISGGNLNPAVTLSLTLTGKMSGLRAVCYIIAQCVGATLGSAFVYSLAPDLFDAAGGAANGLAASPTVTHWTAVGAEMTGTALLLTTVSAAADVGREKNNKYQGALTPLIIGLAVMVAHLFLIPIDGCRCVCCTCARGCWGDVCPLHT